MSTNIDFWENVVNDPPESYKKLFQQEKDYLRKRISKNHSVLDVACGDGRTISNIVDLAGKITGLDIDPKAVADAKQKLQKHPNVEIILGSAFEIPFPDDCFDVIILSMALVNFDENKNKALSELRRVVKQDGKIILSVYSDSAKEERLKMYELVNADIKSFDGNKFIFNKPEHTVSEQFSIKDIKDLTGPLGLEIIDYEEVKELAYLITVVKK